MALIPFKSTNHQKCAGTTQATGTLAELKKNSTVHAKKLTELHPALP
jgi:hypothetical protein